MRLAGAIVAGLVLIGCGAEPQRSQPAITASPPEPAEILPLEDDFMGQWARSCALCHVRGEGGAPVLGDEAAWAPRLAQGEDVLLHHTIEGLNNMPPLGYCMDCEEDDFRSLIRFMGGES